MKYKVKIAILSFLTLFLSLLNLKHGLVFDVTDNTERDAFYTTFEEKSENKDKIKANLASVNVPKSKTTTKTLYPQNPLKLLLRRTQSLLAEKPSLSSMELS